METWNGLGLTPSLFQTVVLIDAACNHESFYIMDFIPKYFSLFFRVFYCIYSLYGNEFDLFLCFIYCVGAVITTLMSISDGSDCTCFSRKLEKTRSVGEEMDGRVFISRQGRHPFSLINNMIKVLFPICTL